MAWLELHYWRRRWRHEQEAWAPRNGDATERDCRMPDFPGMQSGSGGVMEMLHGH
jgi:hypothetical protein